MIPIDDKHKLHERFSEEHHYNVGSLPGPIDKYNKVCQYPCNHYTARSSVVLLRKH